MIFLGIALHFQICYEVQIEHVILSILLFSSCHLPFGRLLFRDSISVHIYMSAQSKKVTPKWENKKVHRMRSYQILTIIGALFVIYDLIFAARQLSISVLFV